MKLFISEMKNLKKRYEQEKDIEFNQINENFKKKKYEMLIEHKETLIKKEQSNKKLKKKENINRKLTDESEENESEKDILLKHFIKTI